MKAKKCIYAGVIVPTALNKTNISAMGRAERRIVSVLEMKYFRSLVGVSQMD